MRQGLANGRGSAGNGATLDLSVGWAEQSGIREGGSTSGGLAGSPPAETHWPLLFDSFCSQRSGRTFAPFGRKVMIPFCGQESQGRRGGIMFDCWGARIEPHCLPGSPDVLAHGLIFVV